MSDATRSDVVERVVQIAVEGARALCIGLHVSALSGAESANKRLSTAVDIAYADGVSVVLLARLAGARRVEKTTTTYIAGEILSEMGRRTGRKPRVALLGGPPGLATEAVPGLREEARVEVAYTCDGYASEDTWTERLDGLRKARPDLVLVGLGHPLEVEWSVAHLQALPPVPILTCGGFFGYLAGHEVRAPERIRRSGLEWAWRTAQAPRRLLPRYARGAWRAGVVGSRILARRILRR